MAFDRIEPKEFFEAGYEVLFHCSPIEGLMKDGTASYLGKKENTLMVILQFLDLEEV